MNAASVLQGHTALVLACDQGHLAVLNMLLAYGADYNATDKQVSLCTGHEAKGCGLISNSAVYLQCTVLLPQRLEYWLLQFSKVEQQRMRHNVSQSAAG